MSAPRRFHATAMAAVVSLLLAAPPGARAQPDLAGSWSFQIRFPPGSMLEEVDGTLEIRSTSCYPSPDRCDFQGTARVGSSSWPIQYGVYERVDNGLYEHQSISFQTHDPSLQVTYRFIGYLSAVDRIDEGSLEYDSRLGRRTGGSWSARRTAQPATAGRDEGAVPTGLASSLLSFLSGGEMGPDVADALGEVRDMLQYTDETAARAQVAANPLVQPIHARLRELNLDRPREELSETQVRAIHALSGVALMASLVARDGKAAFPANQARLQVAAELAIRAATRSDPAEAYQALTALERFTALLRAMDVQALKERYGAEPATGPADSPA